VNPRLEPLKALPDTFERRLGFVALLSEELAARGHPRPVVVGGHALEIYTRGHLVTRDIDVVTGDSRPLAALCLELGLEKAGRHWIQAELGLAIECPGAEVPPRVIEVIFAGVPVRVIAVEELVVDRLNAYVHWKSPRDGDAAEALLAIHGDRADWPYLEKRAREERVSGALAEVRSRRPAAG